MKKYIILIAVVICFNSCLAQEESLKLVGCWLNQHLNENTPDYLNLKLNNNKTFVYNISMDILGKAKLRGKWVVRNDTLILDFITPKQEEIKKNKIEKYSTKEKSRSIQVIAQDTILLVGSEIIINDKDTLIVGFEGKIQINNDIINKLEINDFSLKDKILFYLENDKNNSYIIYVYYNYGERAIVEFAQKKWIVKGKKLYYPNHTNNKQDYLKKYPLKKCIE